MKKERLRTVQKRLFEDIKRGRRKRDFSPFDIYQFVDSEQKEAFLEKQDDEAQTVAQDVIGLLLSAHKEVLIFAGNFSWSNVKQGEMEIIDVLRHLLDKGVKIKILSGIHLPAIENIEKVLSLNDNFDDVHKIEVRHTFQPLRAIIIDDKIARIKEIKNPSDYNKNIGRKTFIFYSIYDKVWVNWLRKVFLNYFDSGDYAQARIRELKNIQSIL